MRYGLVKPDKSVLEINMQQFNELRDAYVFLSNMTHVEEKFDIALENMLELEQEFLDQAAADMMFHLRERTDTQAKLNRRFVNLLTACRLYLDHTDKHAHDLFGPKSPEAAALRAFRSELYDSHLGYRVMEELRNHVQHRGLPIHATGHDSARDAKGQGRHRVSAYLVPSELRSAGKFKSAILHQLEAATTKQTDLLALARDYIECLGDIHVRFRVLAETMTSQALERLLAAKRLSAETSALVRNNEAENDSLPTFLRSAVEWRFRDFKNVLVVVSQNANGTSHVELAFPNSTEIRRRELEAKNARPPKLSVDYVSGEIDDDPLFVGIPPSAPDVRW